MEEIFLAGRILVGGFYLLSAFHHFSELGSLAQYAGLLGVPFPAVAVAVAGILLAIGGLTMILGVYPDIGIAALVLFFVPVTVIMHPFWADRDPTMRQLDVVNFGKNVALLGSSLMFAVIPRPWAYSLERRAHLPVKVPV
ncbi:MAG TPA: DoxX family protein [Polyangia bacterium]|jgi:putative oxidoreductase|nr:DoxX family protein [Polyangia bacterium]